MYLDVLLVSAGLAVLGSVMAVLVLRPGRRRRAQLLELMQSAARPTRSPARSIFISYRRVDSEHIVGRLYEHLVGHYGAAAVFKDVDKIRPGHDFRQEIQSALGDCRVFLCVIGKAWPGSDDGVQRRIDDPADFVRIETETALKRGLPIIPVVVGGLNSPPPEFFPDCIAELAFRHALRLRPDPDFRNDVAHIMEGIDEHLGAA